MNPRSRLALNFLLRCVLPVTVLLLIGKAMIGNFVVGFVLRFFFDREHHSEMVGIAVAVAVVGGLFFALFWMQRPDRPMEPPPTADRHRIVPSVWLRPSRQSEALSRMRNTARS